MKSCFSPLQGAGLWSAPPQLPHLSLCQTYDVHSGERRSGRQGRCQNYLKMNYTCGIWCFLRQLPDPCVLYTRNSASTSASVKIRQLWSLLPQTVALVSLCQQNISHAQQQPSIFICGALVCNAFKAWNTKTWIKGTFSQGWQERSRIFSMKNMSLCKWLWTGVIIQTCVINKKKWGRGEQGDREWRDWKLCRQSHKHKVSGVYCRIVG